MYQRQITDREAGQRLDRYLYKLLPEAGAGFLHKMLRRKNITLNGKKAEGGERLAAGDRLEIFFAQETLQKFMGNRKTVAVPNSAGEEAVSEEYLRAYQAYPSVRIVYENADILLADKPAGLLTQKAAPADVSLNEWLIGYLLHQGAITEDDLIACRPSVCNRLDRNTSGIVLCAKSVRGASLFSDLLKNRTVHKYYQLYVKGRVEASQLIEGYLVKDTRRNRVSVQAAPSSGKEAYIRTSYKPLKLEQDKTLLEVELFTGRPHQIRAHLAGIGHPLLGDYKYGDKNWNAYYRQTCQIRSQLLHAYKVTFPELKPPFEDISRRTFQTDVPELFDRASRTASKI